MLKILRTNAMRPNKKSGAIGGISATYTFWFIFMVMQGGVLRVLVLPDSLPVFQRDDVDSNPSTAAYNTLQHYGILRPNAPQPRNIWEGGNSVGLESVNRLTFVQLDPTHLVDSSSWGIKKYSLCDGNGRSESSVDRTVDGFRDDQYRRLFEQLSQISVRPFDQSVRHEPMNPALARTSLFSTHSAEPHQAPKSSRKHSSGGGEAAEILLPDCEAADAEDSSFTSMFRGLMSGGEATTPSLPTVLCGHDVCSTMEHLENAGHGVILFPWFMYHDRASGATFPVVILVYEKGSWNAMCETMSRSDKGCWYSTITRALREEGKMTLRKSLQPSDGTPVRGSLGRTPVWYLQIGDLVETKLNRATLNARVASDNADPKLPKDFKEIQAIGFFRQLPDGSLVGLPGNPSVRFDVFSIIVKSLLADLVWALPKPKRK
jgi:hypothetical protein